VDRLRSSERVAENRPMTPPPAEKIVRIGGASGFWGDSMVASSSASLRWWSSRCRISASSRSNAGLSARQSSSFRCLKRYIAREIYPRLLSLTSPGGRQR